MKYIIMSDIHEHHAELSMVLNYFTENRYDKIILLGDISKCHRTNSDLTALNKTCELLNQYYDKIIAIRGNCDGYDCQPRLAFDYSQYDIFPQLNGMSSILTHGHRYDILSEGIPKTDLFLSGHTHKWNLYQSNGTIVCNPGSIGEPIRGEEKTFALLTEHNISIRSLHGVLLCMYDI